MYEIDGKKGVLDKEMTIMQACVIENIDVPRFCYHEKLSIAGNCRMCLVEVAKPLSLKPVAACAVPILNGMQVYTNSSLVKYAREGVLEFLLANHPLDCPICDQGGECDLQDQAIFFGSNFSRNYFSRRSVEDKNCGNLIKTIMNRCIHCTRCVRVGEEICGLKFFGTLNRGLKTEIGNYLVKLAISEVSANVVDLCPVGALTLKATPFKFRPWELYSLESIDLTDNIGSNVYLLYKGRDILKVVPKKNILINDSWITNKARFYFNLTYSKQINKFTFQLFKMPCLFLLNADLDLNTLFLFKQNRLKFLNIKSRLVNSTVQKTNFYFWAAKSKISEINTTLKGFCFLISCNLQLEASILNIKLRSKILTKDVSAFSFSFSNSNFPIKFLKFSILEIISLFLGKQLLSQLFFKFNILFFSNKSILDRLDIYFLKILDFKIPQNIFFNISSFCNIASANFLNFKKFNLKEYINSKQIFGFNLNDTFLLRKLFFYNSNFFWVNQFSSNLLSFFKTNIWISLDVNQVSGYYLNIEQKVQKMSLLKSNFTYTIKNFLNLLPHHTSLKFNLIKYRLRASYTFFKFSYLIESFIKPFLYLKPIYKFSFLNSLFCFNYYYYFKFYPIKSVLEDPYRTSLNLKHSFPLIKSSQILRSDFSF